MKKGAATGSISQIETLVRLSPAADSSHPTCKLRHGEFFHLMGSKSLMPVIVPMYLLVPESSVSNIIRKRMPRDIWLLYTAFWYLAKGMTNSDGLALGL